MQTQHFASHEMFVEEEWFALYVKVTYLGTL